MARICARCGEARNKHIRMNGFIVGNNTVVPMLLCPHDQFLEESEPQQVEEKKKPQQRWYMEFCVEGHGDQPYYLEETFFSTTIGGNHWKTIDAHRAEFYSEAEALAKWDKLMQHPQHFAGRFRHVRAVTEEEAIAELWRSRNKH